MRNGSVIAWSCLLGLGVGSGDQGAQGWTVALTLQHLGPVLKLSRLLHCNSGCWLPLPRGKASPTAN